MKTKYLINTTRKNVPELQKKYPDIDIRIDDVSNDVYTFSQKDTDNINRDIQSGRFSTDSQQMETSTEKMTVNTKFIRFVVGLITALEVLIGFSVLVSLFRLLMQSETFQVFIVSLLSIALMEIVLTFFKVNLKDLYNKYIQ